MIDIPVEIAELRKKKGGGHSSNSIIIKELDC